MWTSEQGAFEGDAYNNFQKRLCSPGFYEGVGPADSGPTGKVQVKKMECMVAAVCMLFKGAVIHKLVTVLGYFGELYQWRLYPNSAPASSFSINGDGKDIGAYYNYITGMVDTEAIFWFLKVSFNLRVRRVAKTVLNQSGTCGLFMLVATDKARSFTKKLLSLILTLPTSVPIPDSNHTNSVEPRKPYLQHQRLLLLRRARRRVETRPNQNAST